MSQTSLQSEKQRAGDLEKKCSEEQQANEEKQKKLEETDIKMRQFQEYLRRLFFHIMLVSFYDIVTDVSMFWPVVLEPCPYCPCVLIFQTTPMQQKEMLTINSVFIYMMF